MKKTEASQVVERANAFLEAFFSASNVFRRRASASPPDFTNLIAHVEPELRRHAEGDSDTPILLPFSVAQDAEIVWYACTFGESEFRSLQAELKAFIGPTYAFFEATSAMRLTADAHALPLLAKYGFRHFVMITANRARDAMVASKWRAYRDLMARRPPLFGDIPKTFDELRRDFDSALLAGDERAARQAMSAIKEGFGLSQENRLYLDVRMFAGLELWDRISRHKALPTLVNLNLPIETYGDVLEGLYMTHVYPLERRGQFDGVLEAFKEYVLEAAQPLFRSRRQSKRPAVLKAFVLYEFLQEQPQASVIDALLEQLPAVLRDGFAKLIESSFIGLNRPDDSLQEAWRAYEHEQFDRAADLLWPLDDSLDVLRALVRCVDECRDHRRARELIARVESASEKLRLDLQRVCQRTWPRVMQLGSMPSLDDAPWAERMVWQKGHGETLDAYVDRWKEWARAPALDEVRDDLDFGNRAAHLIVEIWVEYPDAMLRIMPLLQEVFIQTIEPMASLKPVYVALFEIALSRDSFGNVELKLINRILTNCLKAGLSPEEYSTVVGALEKVFDRVRSPAQMQWALETCDILAMEASPRPEDRLRFLINVVQAGTEFAQRMRPADLAMLRMLANERNIEFAIPQVQDDESAGEGSLPRDIGIVGIYSLDEAAVRRAESVLKSMYGDINVRRNSDHVCTDGLKGLAQRASLFVFAWKSSKHAAFYCVQSARRPDQPLVMAPGAGTTSLVNAVSDFIRGGARAAA